MFSKWTKRCQKWHLCSFWLSLSELKIQTWHLCSFLIILSKPKYIRGDICVALRLFSTEIFIQRRELQIKESIFILKEALKIMNWKNHKLHLLNFLFEDVAVWTVNEGCKVSQMPWSFFKSLEKHTFLHYFQTG